MNKYAKKRSMFRKFINGSISCRRCTAQLPLGLALSCALSGVFALAPGGLAAASSLESQTQSFWTQDVWSDPNRPFLFYGEEALPDQMQKRRSSADEKKKADFPDSQGLEAFETLEELQAEVKKRLDRAVMKPTEENMKAYLEANAFLMIKAGRFAESWQSALLQAPQFDWTAQHPTVNFASTELSRLSARKVQEQAAKLSSDWGFIFFGDESDLTRMMLPLVESFAERNGFDTVYVSMTDQNPLMPKARRDRGQASVMAGGIRLFPALVLVRRGDKDPRQARLVATGVVDVAEISRRVVRLASQAEAIDMARIHSAQGFAQREDVFPAFNGAPAFAGSELYEELASGLDEAEARPQEKGSQGAH